MNIQEIDKWLKDQYGISYTEMSNEFNGASELLSKKYKEIKKLNNKIEELELDLQDTNSQLTDYAKRCVKAIEYIETQLKIFKDYDAAMENQLKNIIKIITGSDKE